MIPFIHEIWQWVISWSATPYAEYVLFLVAFAESSFFPIPPDVLLITMGMARPEKALFFSCLCTVGSVLGGMAGYAIGRFGGRPLLIKLVSRPRIDKVEGAYNRYDVWAVGLAAFTPIPYKVFTISAGAFVLNIPRFVLASTVGRGARFFLIGLLFYFFGAPIGKWIEEYLNAITLVLGALFVVFLVLVQIFSRYRRKRKEKSNLSRTCLNAALLFVLSTTSLGASGALWEEREGDWLVVHLGAEPSTLNPITATDVYASRINEYIYESLLKRDEKTMKLVPVLAERWEVSEDHLTYTFFLRKDVRWHDGHPFTARDVLFSYERIMDPTVDAAHLRNYYQDIARVDAIDDYTVRFQYKKPYFRALEFCGGIPIVPAHVFREAGDFNSHPIGRRPIGTGPYRFEKWETGKEIVLTRNEEYWGTRPYLRKIVFKVITDSTVALQVLKQQGLDLMGLQPIQWLFQTRGKRFNRNYRKLSYYLPQYSYIGWNLRKPWFEDKRVRQAMTMLIDRKTILEKLLFGLGTIVTGPFYVNSPDYNKDIHPYPYDPQKAVKLLEEAGWTDHDGDGIRDKNGIPFSFEFLISAGSRFAEQLATIMQESLKEVGIEMHIRRLEWAVFIQKIQSRDFDACTLGWSLGWESDPYQVWHSSQAEQGSNFVGFRNDEADLIIEKARREFDPERRRRLYHRFHEILHEEQPYTFLFTMKALVAVHKRFQDVYVYPMGLNPLEWWVPEGQRMYSP
ncbi:ABC transporter substrate-binding protein [Thermodesulforhabdus norvegica]|uniref:SNARE associated Golgi protein n=1 Tax=Thermodesulforhabdus norvegica TaxID=39841 RepID=A0A1I4VZ79_9BACT|nr:ABC transporter substrate-binding protein [Thermodesulforhabdus norvegica]SFN06513.1 SNARE associated Golgi protein [Thermodesulforhabdus norvegica]